MTQTTQIQTPPPGTVQRQITLPIRKALEIAYKNIRMRLARSLLVTSGIVLALAFLMSIRANEALVEGMRGWIVDAEASPEFAALRKERAVKEQQLKPLTAQLYAATRKGGKLAKDQPKFDPKRELGIEFTDLQKELGASLPATPAALTTALTLDPALAQVMKSWIAQSRDLKKVKDELNHPATLQAQMKNNGVPTTAREIENDRLQTRWLLGLALLVAFVGILNAMLMSVTERFREIGTMKCLGALDSFIIKLFLLESLFQGIIGTFFGIILGLILSVAGAMSTYGGDAWRNPPMSSLGMSILICMVVGVGLTVAGAVYPAWQAARMQPIEAMRVDA